MKLFHKLTLILYTFRSVDSLKKLRKYWDNSLF